MKKDIISVIFIIVLFFIWVVQLVMFSMSGDIKMGINMLMTYLMLIYITLIYKL